MKIGILKTGDIPDDIDTEFDTYSHMIAAMLDKAGLEASYDFFDILGGNFPEHVTTCDGWLVTGSKFGVYEDQDWIAPLKSFIRDSYTNAVPMVGICFGHQIIASALGGTVEKTDIGFLCGNNEYELIAPLPFINAAENYFTIQAMHQDQVTMLGAAARVLAKSAQCPNAALAYGETVLSFQGHPEFSNRYSRDLIETRTPNIIAAERGAQALQNVDDDNQSELVAGWIADFYRGAIKP